METPVIRENGRRFHHRRPGQVQQGKRRGRDGGVGRGRGCVGQPCRPLFPRRRLHHRLSPDSPRHVGSPVTGFRGQGAGAGLPPRPGASFPRSGRGCGVIISLAAERGIRSRQDCLGGRFCRWRIDRGCAGSDTLPWHSNGGGGGSVSLPGSTWKALGNLWRPGQRRTRWSARKA